MSIIIKEIKAKGILTKSNLPVSDYSANTYVGCTHACKYCYASFMKRFTQHVEPWGEFLDIKYWSAIKNSTKYKDKEIFLGSVTDPYNPQEKIYERTRILLKELKGSGIKLSIQTKSDLVLRDIDLIKSFPNARVGFSINTLDENFKNDMDKAVSIKRRLSAMKQLHDAGIRTSCFISPIFPGITDVEAIIEKVKNQCNFIWLENLNLCGSYKTDIMNYIKEKYPKLLPLYKEIYNHGNFTYWENLSDSIQSYARKNKLQYVINSDNIDKPFTEPPTIVNFFYHNQIKKSARKK